jgi:hypothetical protein
LMALQYCGRQEDATCTETYAIVDRTRLQRWRGGIDRLT